MKLDLWLEKYTDIERNFYVHLMQNTMDENWLTVKNLLFMLDCNLQNLIKIRSTSNAEHDVQSNMIDALLPQFKGQLYLHIASCIIKQEATKQQPEWDDVITKVLPLLFMAYALGHIDTDQMVFRNLNEKMQSLINIWRLQSNFRLIQSARTLESSFVHKSGNLTISFENNWRQNLYDSIFDDTSQSSFRNASDSYFLSTADFDNPKFEWPDMNAIITLENQMHTSDPSHLAFQVYLMLPRLRNTSFIFFKSTPFENLKMSVPDLKNCGVGDLNQLDIDTFLYATALQASSKVESMILPFANMISSGVLCTEQQMEIWSIFCAVRDILKHILSSDFFFILLSLIFFSFIRLSTKKNSILER